MRHWLLLGPVSLFLLYFLMSKGKPSQPRIIIVGGGLAGLSAAHTVAELGAQVLLLEKNQKLGGNSAKASSGISAAPTDQQAALGIKDSAVAFNHDTLVSAGVENSHLIEILTKSSSDAIVWLEHNFGVDLSAVTILGGHSAPRTHRPRKGAVGWTITSALIASVQASPNVQVLTSTRLTKLLYEDGQVIGAVFERDGLEESVTGPVILATGGFGHDADLLQQYAPQLVGMPTSNGAWATGDGIKVATLIGANLVDMDYIQVHPTGFVDPSNPTDSSKVLCAEALRGVGGLLINDSGVRFANELGQRDYLATKMSEQSGRLFLILPVKIVSEITTHMDFYLGRGLLRKFSNIEALATYYNIPQQALYETVRAYNEAATTDNDVFGKHIFPGLPFDLEMEYFAGQVTPIVHYTMGGLQISGTCEVLSANGHPIKGLYAAGEVTGGLHGKNRLGGNSLLECVVFGRRAGQAALAELLSKHAN
eukprot:TRINITY_DN2233_c0_g1_i1.p1 TRINITY_DN2233_c0_g1~~TRINITY_DN2233_c0_g1_i1.p1  ORF type:complete len:480 (-),score=46.07 TRINITY_DN2233_c0_g1_i1:11-1450(-)